MTGWTPDDARTTVSPSGSSRKCIGLGFIFVPLSVVTLSTLAPERRAEGAGLYSLSRNIGSSIGISVVNSLLTRNTQVNHAEITPSITAVNRGFEHLAIARFWDPSQRRRTRRARCNGHATGPDHRLYGRLQIIDDRDARCDPASRHLQEAAAQRRRRFFHARDGMTMSATLFQGWLRPRPVARLVSALLGIAVAGCSVGPDFEPPKAPSVSRYTSPGEATATVASPDPGRAVPAQAIALGEKMAADWWTLFRSSELDLLVKQAVAGSRTLRGRRKGKTGGGAGGDCGGRERALSSNRA